MSTDGSVQGQEPVGTSVPPASGLSPEERTELERLRAENAQAREFFSGFGDDELDTIRRIREDESFRQGVKQYREVHENLEHRAPQGYSPEMQRLRDEILSEIKPVKDLVTGHTAQQQQAKAARNQAVYDEGRPIVLAFLESHPELKQSRTFGKTLEMLQAEAVETEKPFKEVWDGYISGFSGPAPRSAPPRQLRASDGEPGIPARTERVAPTQSADGKPLSIKDAFLQKYKQVNGRAG